MASDLKVSNLFDFSKHVVLVTGGATGLGEMAAQGFVQNGARVFIASRKESELKKVGSISQNGKSIASYLVTSDCGALQYNP
jgi:NAD(P)-dependent dehydrogenase (short-subunit alcohol dehydrogenase family)